MYTAGPMTPTSFGKPVVVASEEFVGKRVQASPARPGRGTGRELEFRGRPGVEDLRCQTSGIC